MQARALGFAALKERRFKLAPGKRLMLRSHRGTRRGCLEGARSEVRPQQFSGCETAVPVSTDDIYAVSFFDGWRDTGTCTLNERCDVSATDEAFCAF